MTEGLGPSWLDPASHLRNVVAEAAREQRIGISGGKTCQHRCFTLLDGQSLHNGRWAGCIDCPERVLGIIPRHPPHLADIDSRASTCKPLPPTWIWSHVFSPFLGTGKGTHQD